jgi:hypothetical protein
MSWKGFFEGIQSISEGTLFAPYNALRFLEVDSWWGANMVSWLFILIGFVAFFYWMKQLKTINDNGDEDKSITSHTFLG